MEKAIGAKEVKRVIEDWRRSLLDLSRRNRLLYFKSGRATRIQITSPPPEQLYNSLVGEEKALDFPYALGVEINDMNLRDPSKDRVQIGEGDLGLSPPIQEPKMLRDLLKSLNRLRRGTQTIFEEQGVHTLFVALGLLKWREEETEEIVYSPLVLLPVVLERSKDRFKLRAHEEDVEVNPVLSYKLQLDFNIILPELESEAEEKDFATVIEEFFAKVNKEVGHRGWEVSQESWLAQFAFHKLPMYRDLEGDEVIQRAVNHPVVATICSIREAEKSSEVDIRQVEPSFANPESFPALDTDSSQLEVLERVRGGETIVVQGPPGTGKSQTIVNLIAQALRQGKKVLFLSEKRAALEVVYRRLKEVGLTEPCLDLHSHQTKRKSVVEGLVNTLETALRFKQTPDEAKFEEYRMLVKQLDEYVVELRKPRDKKGRTAYDAQGLLARMKMIPLITCPLPFDRILEVEPNYENELIKLLEQIASLGVWDRENSHPWRDATPEPSFAFMPEVLAQSCFNLVKKCNLLIESIEHEEFQNLIEMVAKSQETFLRALDIDFNLDEAKVEALHGILSQREKAGWWHRFWIEEKVRSNLARLVGRRLSRMDAVSAVHSLYGLFQVKRWLSTKEIRLTNQMKVGANTSFSELEAVLSGLRWICQILTSPQSKVPGQLSAAISSVVPMKMQNQAAEILGKVDTALTEFEMALQDKHFATLFPNGLRGRSFKETPLGVISEEATIWQRECGRLYEWVTHIRLLYEAQKHGLEAFLKACHEQKIPAAQLPDAFRRAYFTKWLEEVYIRSPILRHFHPQIHEQLRQKFRELDQQLQKEAAITVLHKVSENISRPYSEEQRLRREAAKRRRHLPLRRLFPQIPHLLLTLKPCLMMSPLSVATYLPKNHFEFDLVIFDEASQLPPGDAIGALLRAKQAVIFGDNKQLPPTDFFQTHIESQEEEEEGARDYESILDIAGACFPGPMLQWHYRSRDERLIAFSNKKFYNGKLVTFPAPGIGGAETGVFFAYIPDGIYGRGGSRVNKVEAYKVAELILDHFRTQPWKTLGVIAMSIEQRDAIEEALEDLEQKFPDVNIPQNEAEPFFIKNLETVQGDERDVIILSVGYGPTTPGGTPTVHFGPVNREGGERRLNVAITRARYKMIVVTSMRPEQLAGIQTKWEGPRILAEYLKYAQSCEAQYSFPVLTKHEKEAEILSEFEIAVRDALVEHGYLVDCKVGESPYKIDLAIRDPDNPYRYFVGVECDGQTYCLARTARDRDRIRQETLEGLGWKIHRVWSTDWIRDPKEAVARLIEDIEKARKWEPIIPSDQDKPLTVSKELLDDPPLITDSGFPAIQSTETVEQQGEDLKQTPASVCFPKYCTYHGLKRGKRLASEWEGTIADILVEVVSVESPIHLDEALQRVLSLYREKRLGSRVRQKLLKSLRFAIRAQRIVQIGEFLWKPGKKHVTPRGSGDLRRPPEHVAPEEWQAAVQEALRQLGVTAEKELVRCIAEAMGYTRLSADVGRRIMEAITKLKKAGKLEENEGMLYLRE